MNGWIDGAEELGSALRVKEQRVCSEGQSTPGKDPYSGAYPVLGWVILPSSIWKCREWVLQLVERGSQCQTGICLALCLAHIRHSKLLG